MASSMVLVVEVAVEADQVGLDLADLPRRRGKGRKEGRGGGGGGVGRGGGKG